MYNISQHVNIYKQNYSLNNMAKKSIKPIEYFIGNFSGSLNERLRVIEGYMVTVTDSRYPSFVKKFAGMDEMLDEYIGPEFKKNWIKEIQFNYAFESSIDVKDVSKMVKKIKQYQEEAMKIPSST